MMIAIVLIMVVIKVMIMVGNDDGNIIDNGSNKGNDNGR